MGAFKNSGVIFKESSGNFPIFVNQCLANDLLDTHTTYKVQIRIRACYDTICALIIEVSWEGICNLTYAGEKFDSLDSILISIKIE